MERDAIAQAAAALANARLTDSIVRPLPEDCRPATLDDAYAIQTQLEERLTAAGEGARAGYKIGCTSTVMQNYIGVPHPCAGRLYQASVVRSGTSLSLSEFRHPGIELEIAVRLGRDLPPLEGPYPSDTVEDAVESCMGSIEIVDDRYEDWRGIGTPTLVADDFFSAGCVLGDPVPFKQPPSLAEESCLLLRDGVPQGTGSGRDILGDPLAALQWLANNPPAPEGLKAGEIVTLGSVVKTLWIDEPCRLEGRYNTLGSVKLELTD